MWCEVTFLRLDGRRLLRHEWPAPILGNLQITQMHGPNNPFRQHTRMWNLWGRYGSTAQQGLGCIFDPVMLLTAGDGFVARGIELRQADGGIYEYQQLWLCRPTRQGAPPLPPFTDELIDP